MTCGASLTLLGRGGRELVGSGSICVPDPYYNGPDGDPYWASVSLLLHFDGADGETTFTDSSSYNRAFTVSSGAPVISTEQTKFGSAVGRFRGGVCGISTPRTAELSFGNASFTIEFFIYCVTTTAFTRWILYRATSGFYEYEVRLGSGNTVVMIGTTGGVQFFGLQTGSLPLGEWVHVALCWDGVAGGGVARSYVNGALYQTAGGSNTFNTDSSGTLYIGGGGAEGQDFYLDDLRITKGVSRYTGNFTVPSAAYPDYLATGSLAHTVLLLHGETLTDSSSDPKTITASGNATASTAQSVFGGSSLAFVGAGSGYLYCGAYNDYVMPGDFTLEFWALGVVGNNCWWSTAGYDTPYFYNGNVVDILNPGALSYGSLDILSWTHFAVVRSGSTVSVYRDGTLVSSGTSSATLNFQHLELGRFRPGGDLYLTGYIEEFRLTKGVARYTGNFTPKLMAFCNSSLPPYEIEPPPSTVPPETYTDPLWASVRFLSAMDLTKVNLKTSVAYTQDSAAVTATDPFDGAGALACVYPPASPTSTPFDPSASMTLPSYPPGLTIEFWLRVDSWETWTSGAYKWANLCQVDNASDVDAPAFALAIVDELVDGEVVPCFQVYGYHFSAYSFYLHYNLSKKGLRVPVDGAWHNITIAFRYYSPFTRWTATLYVDGAEQTGVYATPGIPRFGGVIIPPNKVGQGYIGFVYTNPVSPSITPTTFAGAVDEIRITAANRYDEWNDFVVPHYAFPRS